VVVNVPSCSLLVVDDEPYVLTTLSLLLAAEFEVLTAASVHAAQELLSQRPVDVVLADHKLPQGTGVELLEWVRQNHPRTVRLLMTGYAEVEDAIAAINRGRVYYFVPKPWRNEELQQILRNAAEKSLLERNRDQLLDQLRQSHAELEQRVTERTRDLEEANQQLHHRNRELERLALTDPLTGLFNRRAVDELARFELKRHARYPSPLALGILDADHFRHINTQHLLTGGDAVLKGLARILSTCIREVDSVGRVGGEEFLVIARETNEEGALSLAERIRSTVANTPVVYQGKPIAVTVSVGFAVADVGVPADYDDMYQLAAGALRQAKDEGRNRSIVRAMQPVTDSPLV
jgi:diguanylate cyclase (GGDEF)-like protein